MAERRMFAKSVIGSARFLRMPTSARLLYYDLGMEADDDGCVEAFSVMRKTGSSEDDLRVLSAKGFVRVLNEDLVTYIADWEQNNKIRKDRYHPGVYKPLLDGLCPIEILPICDVVDNWQPDGNQMATEDRLGKVSIGKSSIGKVSIGESEGNVPAHAESYDYDSFKETYNTSCSNLPPCKILTDKRKKAIRDFLKDFTLDQWKEICEKANASDFLTGKNDRGWKAGIDFLLRKDKAARVLEGGYTGNQTPVKKETQEEISPEEAEFRALWGL